MKPQRDRAAAGTYNSAVYYPALIFLRSQPILCLQGMEVTRRAYERTSESLAGNEQIRWNFFEYGLTSIGAGGDGRNRYTFESQLPPNNSVSIELASGTPGAQISNNLATDTQVEIDGVLSERYPVVDVDQVNRTVTLTFDYVEAQGVWDWIRFTAQGQENKRNMSIIEEDDDGMELFRNNYFDTFPVIFQHFTGFGQPEKVKWRLVIAYGFTEPG